LPQFLSESGKLSREELQWIPAPPATATHRPIPHCEVVQALVETLGFRHIEVVRDEYAVSRDGMKMFGVLDLEYASPASASRSASATPTTSRCGWR